MIAGTGYETEDRRHGNLNESEGARNVNGLDELMVAGVVD
jgi:hypothetical protein